MKNVLTATLMQGQKKYYEKTFLEKKIWLVFILLGICLSLASIFLGNMEYLDDEDNSTARLSFFVEGSVDFLNRDSLTEDDLIIFYDSEGLV